MAFIISACQDTFFGYPSLQAFVVCLFVAFNGYLLLPKRVTSTALLVKYDSKIGIDGQSTYLQLTNLFISPNYFLPDGRYKLVSFIVQPNPNATFIRVAFIALDSENLGEHVNDEFHNDFGDHKFPYFKHNKCSMQYELDSDDEEEDTLDDLVHTNTLTETHFRALQEHLPASVLKYLCT